MHQHPVVRGHVRELVVGLLAILHLKTFLEDLSTKRLNPTRLDISCSSFNISTLSLLFLFKVLMMNWVKSVPVLSV